MKKARRRKQRKFDPEKVATLLEGAPKFFVMRGAVHCDFHGKLTILKPDKPLNFGRHGRFKVQSMDKNSRFATVTNTPRHQKNGRTIHIHPKKNVAISHGMFLVSDPKTA